jgi:multiple sugar transport system permease protein
MKSKNHSWKRDVTGWLIMLPALILFAFFIWEPLLESVRLSLYAAKGYHTTEFVGLDNYIGLFANPDFAIAWKNTILYVVCSLAIGFIVPIFMAAMITESPFLRSFTRVSVYMPNILPGLAVVLIWKFLFNAGDTGVLNILLKPLGELAAKISGEPYVPFNWLTAPGWAIPLIIVMLTWKAAGSTALIYMAGISGINTDIIEAATIDGAKPLRRFFSITLPNLKSLISTMFILQIISVFQILYEPMMIGGVHNNQVSVLMLVYEYAFEKQKLSQGGSHERAHCWRCCSSRWFTSW